MEKLYKFMKKNNIEYNKNFVSISTTNDLCFVFEKYINSNNIPGNYNGLNLSFYILHENLKHLITNAIEDKIKNKKNIFSTKNKNKIKKNSEYFFAPDFDKNKKFDLRRYNYRNKYGRKINEEKILYAPDFDEISTSECNICYSDYSKKYTCKNGCFYFICENCLHNFKNNFGKCLICKKYL